MTGPRYDDPAIQDLSERVGRLEPRLREAERVNGVLLERMEWTPAKWNRELDRALEAGIRTSLNQFTLQRELAETKAALEDALHDAKRWRAIAGAPE